MIKIKSELNRIAIGATTVEFDADGYAIVPKELIFGINSAYFSVVEEKPKAEPVVEDAPIIEDEPVVEDAEPIVTEDVPTAEPVAEVIEPVVEEKASKKKK